MSASLSPYRSTSFDKIFAAIKQVYLINFINFTFLYCSMKTPELHLMDCAAKKIILNLLQPNNIQNYKNRCRLQRELDQNKFESQSLPDLQRVSVSPYLYTRVYASQMSEIFLGDSAALCMRKMSRNSEA